MSKSSQERVEVNIRKCTEEEKKTFEKAKHTELDQWLSSEAVVPVLKAGVPLSRIMKMRWVSAWKTPPEESGETENTS